MAQVEVDSYLVNQQSTSLTRFPMCIPALRSGHTSEAMSGPPHCHGGLCLLVNIHQVGNLGGGI